MRRVDRRAIALLEAIVALAVVALVSSAFVGAERGAMMTTAAVRVREKEIGAASALLDATSLWPQADLDRHLGTRRQGAWRMSVVREGALYRVSISDSMSAAPLVATVLYRRSALRATP